eukprot:CAMPEP_0184711048 /NCGR_PEP_ID=MMETSP0314-20130426/1760_1 /TAXON_ID=38298 /ORGANISM="Rhodella maculata, Strain CCMP 736" /LENGTH=79 /DNA_ID=CAMNT_0027173059 /DNA_START=389 /DNA_END=629 /DNA_ORIENTATION=-
MTSRSSLLYIPTPPRSQSLPSRPYLEPSRTPPGSPSNLWFFHTELVVLLSCSAVAALPALAAAPPIPHPDPSPGGVRRA